MSSCIKLRRGFDLPLKGAAPTAESVAPAPTEVAICPDDFPGFTPKAAVREGDRVNVGSPLLFDKLQPSVCLTSPVAGRVKAIVRGSRRKIERVVVTPDGSADTDSYAVGSTAEAAAQALATSGLWAWMRQLPYGIVPELTVAPRDIFVTAIDSAPLAGDIAAELNPHHLEAGVSLLRRFTTGNIYIGVRKGQPFPAIKDAQTVCFTGPHPVGLASVQANHIAPVNKGETVWLLDIVTLGKIGILALTGKPNFSTTVTLAGPELSRPGTVKSVVGADLTTLLAGRVKDDGSHKRYIAGNVLTGFRETASGFLHYPYRQVTVIAEGDDRVEFMGWASLSPSKMSLSRTFPAGFMPGRKLSADALLHGGRRAMIMSGVYDKMVPMDIMTEPLVKAILGRDIERMEALGIYEVTPDDFALAEWADPSKLELQRIVREGLDYMRSEA
ncbi:MAG: NADH:ubiquinone reductase (Na(+)-transporting) subunit A [Candidatus Amulumruptor caecigallinarius]|nr:NADH:ubiquinone reductase (Na(+)-transporting) subunit A [Candidatus Amulumruptor caecigallinarius]MCM1397678.1 NADH:ubiquinone reductase (Na(+)-transporting) subunit A [Candidatus Amulumruptor caecigallinarius]MCM1454693.1 NADH:ubiquinone reductase (Na(+)-transporting) subunit A [bacterium]